VAKLNLSASPAVTVACAALAVALFNGGSRGPASASLPERPAAVSQNAPSISVDGTGSVEGIPDTVTVSLSVHTHAAHAADALADNNQRTAALVVTLVKSGVLPKDVSSSGLSVSPHYNGMNYNDGYDVTNSVTAVMRDLGHAGAQLDAAASSGGDAVRIGGMSLSIGDPTSMSDKARLAAINNARVKAGAMANAAGAHLGTVRTITESAAYQPQPLYAGDSFAGARAAVPIEPGRQQVQVHVTVVFDLA
jgi:uncharacterized protein YggE